MRLGVRFSPGAPSTTYALFRSSFSPYHLLTGQVRRGDPSFLFAVTCFTQRKPQADHSDRNRQETRRDYNQLQLPETRRLRTPGDLRQDLDAVTSASAGRVHGMSGPASIGPLERSGNLRRAEVSRENAARGAKPRRCLALLQLKLALIFFNKSLKIGGSVEQSRPLLVI